MTKRHELLPEIVQAIASAEGASPGELEYTLYEYVNTDAIDALVTSEHTDWELTFYVPDHTVTLHGDGRIVVDGNLVRTSDHIGDAQRHRQE